LADEVQFGKKRLLIYQAEEDWFAFGPPAFQAEISRTDRPRRKTLGQLIGQSILFAAILALVGRTIKNCKVCAAGNRRGWSA
jgi:hypothetical protein